MIGRGRAIMMASALALAAVHASSAAAQDDAGARRRPRRRDAGSEDSGIGTGIGIGAGTDAGSGADSDGGAAASANAVPPPAAPEEELLPPNRRPALRASVTPQRGVMTGDVVTLHIEAVADEGDDVAVPRQSVAPFEVHRARHHVEGARGGKQRFVFELELLALEPGDHEIPPLRLRVVTHDNVIGSISTRPIRVRVGSVLGNVPDAQPKPPTKPVQVMQDDYTLAWVLGAIGALLLTAIVTLLVARWWRRRPKPAKPAPPPRPAWEIALEKLEALRRDRARLVAEGLTADLADRVSDIVREYLGSRYGFDGLESTTDEVVARMRAVVLTGITLHEVVALLGDCDLVKFAKFHPDEAQCDNLLANGFHIVRATTMVYAPVSAPQAAGSPPPQYGPGAPPPGPMPPGPPPQGGAR